MGEPLKYYTVGEINNYMLKSAKKHTKLSQYTSMEAYEKIKESNSLRLSRITKLNDTTEVALAKDNKNIFIACFTYSHSEFASMWYMYGQNTNGNKGKILLEFKNIFALQNYSFYYKGENDKRIECRPKEVKYKDIVYIDKQKEEKNEPFLKYHTRRLNVLNVEICKNYVKDNAGMVKYKTWDTEKEVRLLVECDGVPPNTDHIYLDFEKTKFKPISATYTINPWVEKNNEIKNEQVSKIYNQIAERRIDGKCEQCKFLELNS